MLKFKSLRSRRKAASTCLLLPVIAAIAAAPSFAAPRAARVIGTPMRANSDFRADLDNARQKVYPTLVNIAVVAKYYDGGRAERAPAGGSGVIISPDGYVLTNFHVAGHTTQITCATAAGGVYPANVVGHDSLADLSVLKLVLPKGSAPLAFATLADSDKLQVGDFVLAMGNPLMLSSSMTLGIASNTKRVFTDFTGTQLESRTLETGEATGVFTRWIQHDALILPGNSGGPLVNLKGEVVGINELGGDGVGFAIPSNIARDVFRQIVKYGKVRRGWLGVDILPVQKLGRTTGALVDSVDPGSPADKAGMLPGEIITAIDDKPITVAFFEQVPLFYQHVATLQAGHKAKISLLNGSTKLVKTATVEWMPPITGDEEDYPTAGLTVRSITQAMAQASFLPDQNGVLITGVRQGYPFDAAQPSVHAGDVIESVGGHKTRTVAAFTGALAEATKNSRPGDQTVIDLRRNGQDVLATVVLNPQTTGDNGGELPQAWIGVKTQVLLPDIASGIGQPNLQGFRVTQVYPFTQAKSAGLKVGDIITKVNDTSLTAASLQDASQFTQTVQGLTIGDTANLAIVRDGLPKTVSVKLEASPDSLVPSKSVTQKELEFSVRDINDIDRFGNHWSPSQAGVLVTDITSGGYASIAGLQVGDLIVSIDSAPIKDIAGFKSVMATASKTRPHSLEVFVRRNASTQFVFVEPDWSKITTFSEE